MQILRKPSLDELVRNLELAMKGALALNKVGMRATKPLVRFAIRQLDNYMRGITTHYAGQAEEKVAEARAYIDDLRERYER
ncbi:MAG: hypothetical protein QF824_00790 [Candidatus Woesearchaeota archaeon]|jgi:hypothetical protein|nr:hypothetical protein [Candidatus Woesearchaeota archaeon]